jgi:hypothetical protein
MEYMKRWTRAGMVVDSSLRSTLSAAFENAVYQDSEPHAPARIIVEPGHRHRERHSSEDDACDGAQAERPELATRKADEAPVPQRNLKW